MWRTITLSNRPVKDLWLLSEFIHDSRGSWRKTPGYVILGKMRHVLEFVALLAAGVTIAFAWMAVWARVSGSNPHVTSFPPFERQGDTKCTQRRITWIGAQH